VGSEFLDWQQEQLLDISLGDGDRFLGFLVKVTEEYAEFALPKENIQPNGGFRLLSKETKARVRLGAILVIREYPSPRDWSKPKPSS
jgi:hypothetical protein